MCSVVHPAGLIPSSGNHVHQAGPGPALPGPMMGVGGPTQPSSGPIIGTGPSLVTGTTPAIQSGRPIIKGQSMCCSLLIISPDESRGYIGFRSVAPPPP